MPPDLPPDPTPISAPPPAAPAVAAPAPVAVPDAPPAPVAAPAAAPVVEAAPAAPVPDAPPAPAAAVPDAPPAPAADPHPIEVPTLLDSFGKEAAKPGDPAKPEATPPKAPDAPASAPEWKFETPTGLTLDDVQRHDFTNTLNGLLTPAEGETRDQYAQKLLDMHVQARIADREELAREQVRSFNKYREEKRTEVMADPVIGGNGHQTAMQAIARMRDMSISDHKPGTKEYEADAKEYMDFLRITGAGDHPAYLKQLHRFARFYDEPSIASVPPNPKPPPDIGKPPGKRSVYANTPPSRGN